MFVEVRRGRWHSQTVHCVWQHWTAASVVWHAKCRRLGSTRSSCEVIVSHDDSRDCVRPRLQPEEVEVWRRWEDEGRGRSERNGSGASKSLGNYVIHYLAQ